MDSLEDSIKKENNNQECGLSDEILEYKQYLKEIKDTERLSCKLTSYTNTLNEPFEKSTLKLLDGEIEPVVS